MKKIIVFYGEYDTPIQKKSIEVLSELLLDYTGEYPAFYKCGEQVDLTDKRVIYIGTKKSNPYINSNSKNNLTTPEEYAISIENDVITIEGFDDAGVLYGAVDFYNKYLIDIDFVNFESLDGVLKDKTITSKPSIKNRGLWTWGHEIYDYKRYIDNMVKLKFNTLVMWNEFLPINAREVYNYAHSCNVKLVWGYSWLYNFNKPVELENLDEKIDGIIKEFEECYQDISADGIYFQTFTESNEETFYGVDIAKTATDFVNKVASRIFEKYPNLEVQFGLHATSVKNKLDIISSVDKRVRIVWEDCGAFPYSYAPNQLDGYEETLDFSKKIAVLRGKGDNFGVVTKGFTCLDWKNFVHHTGPYFIGVATKKTKEGKYLPKRKTWRWVQSFWTSNKEYVKRLFKEIYDLRGGDIYCTALVEAGLFEEKINFAVATYAEILWNVNVDLEKEYNLITLRNYVEFA